MRQTIEQRGRELFVAGKHGDPVGEREIGGHDRRATFVPVRDQIEEQLADRFDSCGEAKMELFDYIEGDHERPEYA